MTFLTIIAQHRAVELQHIFASGRLVQSVDILRDDAGKTNAEKQQLMAATMEQGGLSVARFNYIGQRIQTDEALMTRFNAEVAERSAAQAG